MNSSNDMKMAEELKSELDEVDSELVYVEQQIEQLLEQQQKLLERRQVLRAQLETSEHSSVQEQTLTTPATVDWERGRFSWSERIQDVLKSVFKIDTFRPLQPSCVNATLSLKDTILIMPTGGGKSLCYQLPAILSAGITLVVSPLVSLMEDQLLSVKNLNIEASLLNASCSKMEVTQVLNAMTDKQSRLKLLYVTPEKIAKSKRFLSRLEKTYELGRLSRIVIDEVHCASQWGHDFRPDYKILGILKSQFPNAPILGLTATATAKVLTDVKGILSLTQCLVFRASYNRSNLFYEVRGKPVTHKAQIDEMAHLIKARFSNQSGIVYCLSRKDSEQVCVDLSLKGIKAGCYHADLPGDERSRVHRHWLNNDIQVIVATVAFGMGIDKPDVRFVVHHTISKSIENYYQESGRAGRDGKDAYCIVYFRATDLFRQSTMVFTEHTGLQNLYIMLKYCLNEVQCRRSVIAKCFGEQWKPEDCNNHCDICQRLNGCSSTNYTAGKLESGSGSRYITIDENISGHCQLLVEIVEEAHHKQQRLTALKVIETWRKKLKTITRSKSNAHGERTYDSEAERERILLHAIVEGVLKEEFHFTPYSTISYIGIGRKAAGIRRGTVTMTLQRLVAQTTQSVSSASVSSHKEGLYSEAISDCATLEQSARKRSLSESPADDSVQTSSKKRLKSVKQQRDVKRNECCKTKKVGEKSRTASDDVVTIEID